ncbi:MAG: hypothetical protein JWP37_1174 [Mucilaginibacter sp.]|nr:hypothetical protein [Mucilaginibacter sp.]
MQLIREVNFKLPPHGQVPTLDRNPGVKTKTGIPHQKGGFVFEAALTGLKTLHLINVVECING